jgi:hypothetical protein
MTARKLRDLCIGEAGETLFSGFECEDGEGLSNSSSFFGIACDDSLPG